MIRAQTCDPYWASPATGAPTNVRYLAVFDDGDGPRLYAGGDAYIPGYPAILEPFPLFKWDGLRWLPQDVGVGGECVGLMRLQDATGPFLFLAGYFTGGGPPVFWGMIRRPGGTWGPSPPGFLSTISAPKYGYQDGQTPVIVGLTTVGQSSIAVASWTGSAWQVLGGATDYSASGFAALHMGSATRLCVCGGFGHIGGVAASGVAMWNGANWIALGPPNAFLLYPRTLAVYDDGTGEALYVGGDGQPPQSPAAGPPLFKWTGTQWVEPGGGLNITTNTPLQVNAMSVLDDGTGPALYAAGSFNRAGGIPVHDLARWNGVQWQGLGAGIGFQVQSFAGYDDGRGNSLFAAGSFTTAGGGTAPGVAQWVGCPNCYANCDNSTIAPRLNVLDFMCFLNKFVARDPYANCNVDATIDINDFVCFMSKFAVGCP